MLGAINAQTGMMAGTYCTLLRLPEQVANAFIEKGLFRGLMLPHLMRRFNLWRADALQAALFGLAYVVFPLAAWVRGQAALGDALGEAAMLLVSTTVGGLVFGCLYYRTDSLWTAWSPHLLDNMMVIFVNLQTASRLNAETDILALVSAGFLALVAVAWITARRFKLPSLQPWS